MKKKRKPLIKSFYLSSLLVLISSCTSNRNLQEVDFKNKIFTITIRNPNSNIKAVNFIKIIRRKNEVILENDAIPYFSKIRIIFSSKEFNKIISAYKEELERLEKERGDKPLSEKLLNKKLITISPLEILTYSMDNKKSELKKTPSINLFLTDIKTIQWDINQAFGFFTVLTENQIIPFSNF